MRVRHFDALWLLFVGACAFESGGASDFAPEVAGITSGASTTEAVGETDKSGDTSNSSTASVADGSSDGSSSAGTETTGTSGATSGTGGATCGNGVPDGDEECDDGNDNDFDGCSSCRVPTCDDGQPNGDETDIDCGGSCKACALCQTCQDGPDCDNTLVCGADGQCVTRFEMAVDWLANCGSSAQGITIQGLAPGTYRATAILSAGTRWLPPHTPPSTGYYYDTACTGVSFEQMRTPVGLRYIDINTAFSNMITETETFDYAGGDFTCWAEDDGCGDNDGSVEFSFEYVCGR